VGFGRAERAKSGLCAPDTSLQLCQCKPQEANDRQVEKEERCCRRTAPVASIPFRGTRPMLSQVPIFIGCSHFSRHLGHPASGAGREALPPAAVARRDMLNHVLRSTLASRVHWQSASPASGGARPLTYRTASATVPTVALTPPEAPVTVIV
jgi:hypothetical protein